jgi:O-antigen/teichoic acid export membrane protein
VGAIMAQSGTSAAEAGGERPAPCATGIAASLGRRLFSTASLLSAARIAGALAGFVTQVVLARALHASALGLFFSVTSMAALMSLIAAHGYPVIAARFLSRYRKQGNQQWVAAFIARSRRDATIYVTLATAGVVTFALLWPGLATEARVAVAAAAMSIPALASIRINGALATTLRHFALSYLPDTCIRPFFLLFGIVLLLAIGVPLTASGVTWLLTAIVSGLALAQYLVLERIMPHDGAPASMPARLVKVWQREATPLIVVALFTFFFADVDILLVTPLLTSAETAIIGLCLKIAVLVGFVVQVAHQVVTPELADARAHKDGNAMQEALVKALSFPLAITGGATVAVLLFGEHLLTIFGPEFAGAKWPLVILMGSQLARAVFGPNIVLLTVIGAQKENAGLAIASLAVLAVTNLVLAPLYGVLGAALAVAIATLFWLVASAIVIERLGGLRPDAVSLLVRVASKRSTAV